MTSGGFNNILGNLQVATVATFVDMSNIAGLGIINYVAVVGKALVSPMVDGGMIGMFIGSCVEGTHDLAKWYYLRAAASTPTATGTTTAG